MYRAVGMGQTTVPVPATVSMSPSLSPLLLLGGAALAGLIFLPGMWKVAVPGGLFAWMVVGNWQQCSQIAGDSQAYLLDQTTGKPVVSTNPAVVFGPCPTGHVCTVVAGPATAAPQWSCLSNPFPGGL